MLYLAKDKKFEDLKEFGFEREYVAGEYYWSTYGNMVIFAEENRCVCNWDDWDGIDLLFDLIVAGFIEKRENKTF